MPAPLGLSASERERWAEFPERNLGFVMLQSQSPLVRALLESFAAEFVRQVNDSKLTKLVSDQPAWRSALFTTV